MKTTHLIFLFVQIIISVAYSQNQPQGVRIISSDAQGSGCPIGTTAATISPDQKELSLIFDQFIAESNQQNQKLIDKKVCIMNVNLAIPSGWQIGLISADYRGFVALDAGSMGQHDVLYSFNKSFVTGSFGSDVFRGPMNDSYTISHQIQGGQISWSPCGVEQAQLTVRTSIVTQSQRSNGQISSAMVTLDSVDTSVRQSFKLAMQKCSGNNQPSPQPQPNPRPQPIPPGGGNVPPAGQINIFQLWDGKDLLLTTDSRLVERGAWVNQGIAFRLFRSQTSTSQIGLYNCLNLQIGKHFVSSSSSCEGQKVEGLLGYMNSLQTNGLVPLMRFTHPQDNREKRATTVNAEVSGWKFEKTLGYVLPTR